MKKLLALLLALISVVGVVGCKNKKPTNPAQTLEIYALDVGYGVAWCDAIIEEFKKQDWVKEKYPNLNIPRVQSNDITTFASSKVKQGKTNTIDLFFDELGASLADQYYNSERIILNLTESVYNKEVPGENVLYKDKMLESIRDSSMYMTADNIGGDPSYYYSPWYIGQSGINYNADVLKALNLEVPLTTKQWLNVMESVKQLGGTNPAYKKTSSIIQSKDAPNYFEYMLSVWWAQYEGLEGYYNYFNGISNNRISKDIFKQKGRLYSLKVFEEVLDYDKGYLDTNSFLQEYMVSQTDMLSGNALFHINGDWFDREMNEIRNEMIEEGYKVADTRMMRTPIVSEIVEKTPSITAVATSTGRDADDVLADVIKAVDANNPALCPDGVSETDYAKVKEARGIVFALGSCSSAYIPSYAEGKEIAIDFLRFMATDIAHDAYIKATRGASLPFKYDVSKSNPTIYNNISEYQKVRQGYFTNTDLPQIFLPMPSTYPLARFGGVGTFTWANYYTSFSAASNTRTAEDYYNATIEYWTDSKWQEALANAGM